MQQQQPSSHVVPVLSLVPSNELAHLSHINRKYWHIICKAELTIPHGLQFVKISIFLVWYNNRYYISIIIQLCASLEAASTDLEYPQLMAIAQPGPKHPLPVSAAPLPVACSVFELPKCPRCFLDLGCQSHIHPVC